MAQKSRGKNLIWDRDWFEYVEIIDTFLNLKTLKYHEKQAIGFEKVQSWKKRRKFREENVWYMQTKLLKDVPLLRFNFFNWLWRVNLANYKTWKIAFFRTFNLIIFSLTPFSSPYYLLERTLPLQKRNLGPFIPSYRGSL